MAGTFHVKNFDRLQHYKDRSPPWIKLYNGLLDDYEFAALPDASKAHLLAIGLLASRYTNKIPLDAAWVGKRINATTPVDFAVLIKSGFIIPDQDCSELLAEREQVAMPEREGETEQRQSRVEESTSAEADDAALAFAVYNVVAKQNDWPEAQRLNAKRRRALKTRLVECGGLDGWREAMERAGRSDFLTGRTPRSNGHESWMPDLDFFLQSESFTKLMEGKYDNHKSAERGGNIIGALKIALAHATGDGDGNSDRAWEVGDCLPVEPFEGRKRIAAR